MRLMLAIYLLTFTLTSWKRKSSDRLHNVGKKSTVEVNPLDKLIIITTCVTKLLFDNDSLVELCHFRPVQI